MTMGARAGLAGSCWRSVFGVALLSCACAMVAPTSAGVPEPDGESPLLAPAWELKTPEGGSVRFPQDAQHRPSVLLFWPSWCPYSRALQPYVQDIWSDYRGVGVNVWTINIKEKGDPVLAMRERGLSFPLLLNGDALIRPYRIERSPWLVVIDGQNRIVYTRPPHPPTPIEVAKDVRKTLNGLLGAQAVPLPTSYPPPYDLHLKGESSQSSRLVPARIAESEWQAWVEHYLSAIPAGERRAELPARGAISSGKQAIALAREVWTQIYGSETVKQQAPYRAYLDKQRWVVLADGQGGALGSGLILVVEASTGQVIRVTRAAASP